MNSDRVGQVVNPLVRRLIAPVARRRSAHFEAAPATPGRVVLLGDSITEQGLWDAWLPELPTLNRGIGGDTTRDLLRRLDNAVVAPAAVSLLIGTNDLVGPRGTRDPGGIAHRTETILRGIRDRAPRAQVLLNSVLPRTAVFADRIREVNVRYQDLATRFAATYVDLWPTFADGSGALRPDLTRDHLHLTPEGYRAWSAILRPHLAAHATDTDSLLGHETTQEDR